MTELENMKEFLESLNTKTREKLKKMDVITLSDLLREC